MAGLLQDTKDMHVEDLEDQWLYGAGEEDASQHQVDATGYNKLEISAEVEDTEQRTNYQDSTTPTKDYPFEEDSSSDSDSDDVQIHIGQIRTTPFSQPYRPQQKPPPGGYGPTTDNVHNKINLGEIGQINGQPIFNYDMNSSDKPWKQPGADISDYFNYGFTEETWRIYCDKQKKMRTEVQVLTQISQGDSAKMIPTIGQQNHFNQETPTETTQQPMGTPPPEGRSTPEMDTGYPMRGPVVPGPGKVPLLSGVRPSLGSGPELPFMPNMLPFGGPFPGPDGMPMARPPFPLPHMVPPFTGPMEGSDENLLPPPEFMPPGPPHLGGPLPFGPPPGLWDSTIGDLHVHPNMGKTSESNVSKRDSRWSDRRHPRHRSRSVSSSSSYDSDNDRSRRSRRESNRSNRRERRRRSRSRSRSRSHSRERSRRHRRDRDRDRDRDRSHAKERDRKDRNEERDRKHESRRRRHRSHSRSRSLDYSTKSSTKSGSKEKKSTESTTVTSNVQSSEVEGTAEHSQPT